MASQSATLVGEEPEQAGRIRATLALACGCTVTRKIAADRIVDTKDGRRIAVGKYPCPEQHPVRPPQGT